MGEWQLDCVRSSWEVARERAVARGVHIASKPPTGYRRGPSGRLVIDSRDGAVISELFARRAEGEAIMALCRRLERQGVRTPFGNAIWNRTTVRQMLSNRAYLGEAHRVLRPSGTIMVQLGLHSAPMRLPGRLREEARLRAARLAKASS
jgi:hypothetical protein